MPDNGGGDGIKKKVSVIKMAETKVNVIVVKQFFDKKENMKLRTVDEKLEVSEDRFHELLSGGFVAKDGPAEK